MEGETSGDKRHTTAGKRGFVPSRPVFPPRVSSVKRPAEPAITPRLSLVYTFVVPLASLNLVDTIKACDVPLYIVTHAEVDMDGNPCQYELKIYPFCELNFYPPSQF